MSFTVEIHGGYGDADVDVVLMDDGQEIVMWTSDEWKEDPSLVSVIANAIRIGYEQGPDAIRARIEKN
jgi:hypothetical protein